MYVTCRQQSYSKVEQWWHKASILTLLPSNALFVSLCCSHSYPWTVFFSTIPLVSVCLCRLFSTTSTLNIYTDNCFFKCSLASIFLKVCCVSIHAHTDVYSSNDTLSLQGWDFGGIVKDDAVFVLYIIFISPGGCLETHKARLPLVWVLTGADLCWLASYCLPMTDNRPLPQFFPHMFTRTVELNSGYISTWAVNWCTLLCPGLDANPFTDWNMSDVAALWTVKTLMTFYRFYLSILDIVDLSVVKFTWETCLRTLTGDFVRWYSTY